MGQQAEHPPWTGQLVRNWINLAAEVLTHNAEMLNGLNVFPVADSDTGSNMAASMRGAATAVAESAPTDSVPELLAIAARGALRAGRGNSGVILSEWLRGFAQSFQVTDSVSRALEHASCSAHDAVARPAPGTILTAAQDAAQAAPECILGDYDHPFNGWEQAEAAVEGARDAAKHSPAQLATLARAGVPDAGACGLVLVLGALQVAMEGKRDYRDVELGFDPYNLPKSNASANGASHDTWQEGDDADEDGFEVMFTLRRPAGATEFATGELAVKLRAELAEIGKSVVVVGGLALGDSTKDSEWHAHVHVSDLPAVKDLIVRWRQVASIAAIQVRHLAVPAGELNVWVATKDVDLVAEFARAGAVVLVPSGDSPVSSDIVSAVKASPTTANIVLVDPSDVEAVSDGLKYPTDLILGIDNPAAAALMIMVVSDQISAGMELESARETAARLVTATTAHLTTGLPPVIAAAAASELVVAAVPRNEPPLELEAAREECEGLGAELVVIPRSDSNPIIQWATELPDDG